MSRSTPFLPKYSGGKGAKGGRGAGGGGVGRSRIWMNGGTIVFDVPIDREGRKENIEGGGGHVMFKLLLQLSDQHGLTQYYF